MDLFLRLRRSVGKILEKKKLMLFAALRDILTAMQNREPKGSLLVTE